MWGVIKMRYLQITVLTPHGQASIGMKLNREAILGYKKSRQIIKEKLLADNKYYYIVPVYNDEEYNDIIIKCARAEVIIKKFYSILIKTIDRANKLATKFKKGASWVKKWIIKRLTKQYGEQDNNGFIEQIKMMSDEEILDFIKINDRKEMMELLAGELILPIEIDNDNL